MIALAETSYYAETDPVTPADLFSLTVREDGACELSPAAGGWLRVVSRKDFEDRFVEVPAATISGMLSNYRAADMTYLDEGDECIRGYVNDDRWNGWLMPLFTREQILASIGDGLLSGQERYLQVLADPLSDDLFMLRSSGGTIDEPWSASDFDDLLSMEDYQWIAVGEDEGDLHEFWRLRPKTIVVDGDDLAVYDTSGIGWTWMELPAPAPALGR